MIGLWVCDSRNLYASFSTGKAWRHKFMVAGLHLHRARRTELSAWNRTRKDIINFQISEMLRRSNQINIWKEHTEMAMRPIVPKAAWPMSGYVSRPFSLSRQYLKRTPVYHARTAKSNSIESPIQPPSFTA